MTIGDRIGEVTHYFNHLSVAVLALEQDLRLGDLVQFLGANTDFGQEVTSMQMDHQPVTEVAAGQEVAVRVRRRVRRGDFLYRVTEVTENETAEWFGDLAPGR